MSIFAGCTPVLKIKIPFTFHLNMHPKVIYSIWLERRSISARILLFTFSSRSAREFITCTSKVLFTEISSLKISWSKKATLLKFAISAGVSNLTTANREILFVEPLSTWLLRWSRTKRITTPWISGPWVSCSTSSYTVELPSQVSTQERSATRSCVE